MIGAAITHARARELPNIAVNVVLFAHAAVIAWGRFGPYARCRWRPGPPDRWPPGTLSPAAAASGETRVPLVHRTTSAGILCPSASSTVPASTFTASDPLRSRTPRRSSAAYK
ncbi:DoxX family protein [Streptomyces sp. NPDC056663]|uniref:DoxX family protein n=1 Tax=Streptomyces sp. NPDC056663 TaxID=3345899 RepID=UPI00369A5A06